MSARFLLDVLRSLTAIAVVAGFGVPCAPVYLLLRGFLGRPPVVPSPRRVARVLGLALGRNPDGPGASVRLFVTLAVIRRIFASPLWGLGWWLDELLYGRALDDVAVEAPILELSAARSGSTQLAHYLEDDPHTCAPNVLQALLPFLWSWRIAACFDHPRTRAWVSRRLLAGLPGPHLERHEADAFRTDTIEVLYVPRQLGDLAAHLSPTPMIEDYGYATLTDTNRDLWLTEFVPWLVRLSRKTLVFAGPGRRLLVKGHFLAAADAVAAAFPGGRFLTVIRPSAPRLQSVVNFHHTQPADIGLGYVRWPWLVTRALAIEPAYEDAERAWYTAPTGPRRVVVRFSDYLRDLPGTLERVYRDCLDEAPPPHLPRTHAPRVRTNYTFDKGLAELGIDQAALAERTRAHQEWCSG